MRDATLSVDLNGTTIHLRDVGSGPPVVFVPGLGSGHGMFEPQVQAFRDRYRLILPDLRGNGRSGRLTGPAGAILDRQTDDLAALMDALGLERAAMVGVSYGGVVGLHFALRHPDRLAGLAIADTFADIDRRHPVEFLFWVASYAGLWVCYLPKPILKALIRLSHRRWPAARDAIPRLIEEFRPTEAVLQSLAMNEANYPPRLGQIACPVLGIVGDYTKTGVRFMKRAVAPIPRARLEIIADSFDPSNLCQPEAFNRRVGAFLEEVGRRDGC